MARPKPVAIKRMVLRLPERLHGFLQEFAKEDMRSLNTYLVYLCQCHTTERIRLRSSPEGQALQDSPTLQATVAP